MKVVLASLVLLVACAPKTDERIPKLEQRVATLESQVKELKSAPVTAKKEPPPTVQIDPADLAAANDFGMPKAEAMIAKYCGSDLECRSRELKAGQALTLNAAQGTLMNDKSFEAHRVQCAKQYDRFTDRVECEKAFF